MNVRIMQLRALSNLHNILTELTKFTKLAYFLIISLRKAYVAGELRIDKAVGRLYSRSICTGLDYPRPLTSIIPQQEFSIGLRQTGWRLLL